jgi:DNA-binding Xre family transcriptional regulator
VVRTRLKLKELLDAKGISQGRMSRISDVSLNSIQNMRQDPSRDVLISTLAKLAIALQVPVQDLFEVIEDSPKQE